MLANLTQPISRRMQKTRADRASPRRVTLSLGALESYLSATVRRLHYELFTEVTRALLRLNLTPGQYTILVAIGENRGVKQIDIATAIGIQKANLAPTIALLEERALIRRDTSAIDGRFHCLAITTPGKALLADATRAVESIEARISEILGSNEVKAGLVAQLKALTSVFSPRAPTKTVRQMKAQAWKEANI
jgi:DNA-binding MarR family transcriptional regulator